MDFSGKLYVAIKSWFDNIYDLYINPTPKNVVLQNAKVDANGNVSDVTIPNMAMQGKKVDDFILNGENLVKNKMVSFVYLDVNGDDSNSGTKDSRKKTIEGAIESTPYSSSVYIYLPSQTFTLSSVVSVRGRNVFIISEDTANRATIKSVAIDNAEAGRFLLDKSSSTITFSFVDLETLSTSLSISSVQRTSLFDILYGSANIMMYQVKVAIKEGNLINCYSGISTLSLSTNQVEFSRPTSSAKLLHCPVSIALLSFASVITSGNTTNIVDLLQIPENRSNIVSNLPL